MASITPRARASALGALRLARKGCAGLSLALGLAVVAAAPVAAERLQSDFTFRRVSVPKAGTAKRITVQIAPRPPRAPAAPAAAGSAATTGSGAAARSAGTEWFWAAVSPRLADTGPGRLDMAIRAMASLPQGQGVAAPRVQQLQDIARLHGTDIMRATIGTKVSPALALAVIAVESAGRTDAQSGAGAQGLMQLMPATAARFGVTNRLIAPENIRGGVAYLDWLMGHFASDPILVLAGYNAGEGSVRDNAGVPPYAETRAYVPKVLAAWSVARGLCQTPPVLISDGCVFSINNL